MQGPENEMVSPSGWLPIAGQHHHVCLPAGINATKGGKVKCCVYSHMAILRCIAQHSLTPARCTACDAIIALSILVQIALAVLDRYLFAILKGIALLARLGGCQLSARCYLRWRTCMSATSGCTPPTAISSMTSNHSC